jgi:hypothetical protein
MDRWRRSEAFSSAAQPPPSDGKPRGPAFPLAIKGEVEVAGFEPAASSVRVGGDSPPCAAAFVQVAADRQEWS